MLRRAWLARHLGTPTLGTRVAGIVAQRTAEAIHWVAADAGAAAGIPAAPHRGRARIAASLALAALLGGLAWLPALAVIGSGQQQATETAYRYDEARQQAYQATAEGFTRDLYAATLGEPVAATAYLARGDKGYAAADKTLSDFFARSQAEKVSAWTFGLADVPAVRLDPEAADRATVAIPVIETTPQGDRVVTLRFIVIDPQSNSSGADESWTLAAIDRDELRPSTAAPAAADARSSVNMVLGVGGYGQGDAGNQQLDAPKRMTPEFAASADGRLLASQFGPTSTPETIGDRRDIIRVTYQGDRALVHTREEWISGAGSSQTRDYIYTVRSASPFALIERRQLAGN
jgi:hypothetical protein